MNRRKFITIAASTGTIAALAGCASSEDDSDTASGDRNTNEDTGGNGNGNDNGDGGDGSSGVEILTHNVVESDIGSYVEIHGEIQNNTGEEQSYVEIRARFRDEDGTRVDDAFTNFTDVANGETLRFEIMTTLEPNEFAEYELETSTSPF
ncbi:FxLYD domain-containing protein [Natrinema caseinilyticum]|uniref:FxLYD domain-containing protein n=1 Tax=Natrinema caseinilyticum TaxID=2961570 RepID=UPI0020C30825|nr:FxLYD domain-containing protein [Natrinema caseinilyticum]